MIRSDWTNRILAFSAILGCGLTVWALWPSAQPTPESVRTLPAQAAPNGADQLPSHAPRGCPHLVDGDTVTGNGPGSTDDGPSVILAFEYAYFTLRDGTIARDLATEDAVLPPAHMVQRGIDHTPVVEAYCVHITPAAAPGVEFQTWAVTISVDSPGEPTATLRQQITTRSHGGRTLIAGIRTDG